MSTPAFLPFGESAYLARPKRGFLAHRPAPAPLRIGLLNNMPDAALRATERQFGALLRRASEGAAGAPEIRLKLLHLPELPRGPEAREDLAARYAALSMHEIAGLDALIITGNEPTKSDMRDEPLWRGVSALAEWTRANHLPTVWSCMAAHAAVLHYDGIARRRFEKKLSGVFEVARMSNGALIDGVTAPLAMPHSRSNTLDAGALLRADYELLTASPETGADVFIKRAAPHALFTQGHPEYGAEVLGLEYRRDLRRFFAGQRAQLPDPPQHYFSPAVEKLLTQLNVAASDRDPSRLAAFEAIIAQNQPLNRWQEFASQLYAGWLDLVAARAAAHGMLQATG